MNDDMVFHFSADLITQLVNGIPTLFRGKKEVLLFCKGAGVPQQMLQDLSEMVEKDKDSIKKVDMVCTVISRLNEAGERALGPRRQILQRVCDFEDFTYCWPEDQPRARAAVSEIRRLVDVKDTFTRMRDVAEGEQRRRGLGPAGRRRRLHLLVAA